MLQANPIPDWHPLLKTFQHREPEPAINCHVTFYHPDIDAEYAAGMGVDLESHPNIATIFETFLPPTHPDIMELLVRGC